MCQPPNEVGLVENVGVSGCNELCDWAKVLNFAAQKRWWPVVPLSHNETRMKEFNTVLALVAALLMPLAAWAAQVSHAQAAPGDTSVTVDSVVPVSLTVRPAEVVLVSGAPERVRVLSLGNSLIYYNYQDSMFNDIAQAMGMDAQWTRHTLMGKALSAHWNEGDSLNQYGAPSAKMMVRSQPWTHIILQEQSKLPRTDPAAFATNVKRWVAYIRANCPNPDAVIILPVNWAYITDWATFTADNQALLASYVNVARECGVTLCPVGVAYQTIYDTEGPEAVLTWFRDTLHPTVRSTYLAAVMEYGLIVGTDPADVVGAPAGMTVDEAAVVRGYASRVLHDFANVVDHIAGKVRLEVVARDPWGEHCTGICPVMALDGGGTVDDDGVFVSNGDAGRYTLSVTCGALAGQSSIRVVDAPRKLIGDMNGDGRVDVTDINLLVSLVLGRQ